MPRSSSAGGSLRAVTARGGALNAAFLSGAEGLVLLQGLLATALLGPSAIGLYGVVTTTAMTIVALRRVGIDEAFVQQAAEDEEAEFQRAFGVELAVGLAASLAIALLAPLLAAVYDDDRLLALTLGVAYLPVAFSLQAPQWVFFRRMDFLRLRLLQAIVPLGTVLVTVPLLLADVGVWALVIGPFCAHVAAVIAAAAVSPYRLRPRFERDAARRYLRFSWPVFATAVAAMAVAQGQVAVFGLSDDGLAAAGWITLAATLTRYADRADQIVATTIYPAIVRVRERVDVLEELFAKSNRLTLMWAFPFGAGLALFGADLVGFVLGDDWEPAVVLLGGLAAATALQQLGYNWFAFYRARGESRPQAVESAVFAGSFALLVVPATLAWGSWGFVIGRLACTACVLAVRRRYVLRLLPGARLGAIALRAALPVVAATVPVLALRLALWGGDRPLVQALAELALWLAGLVLATRRLEAGLLGELWAYLRPGGERGDDPARPAPAAARS
jgi:O-antigen/teichoic acid export membrane protein